MEGRPTGVTEVRAKRAAKISHHTEQHHTRRESRKEEDYEKTAYQQAKPKSQGRLPVLAGLHKGPSQDRPEWLLCFPVVFNESLRRLVAIDQRTDDGVL